VDNCNQNIDYQSPCVQNNFRQTGVQNQDRESFTCVQKTTSDSSEKPEAIPQFIKYNCMIANTITSDPPSSGKPEAQKGYLCEVRSNNIIETNKIIISEIISRNEC
jgi:hypothetical protein